MKKVKLLIVFTMILCLIPTLTTQAAIKQINIKVTTSYKIVKGEKLKLYVKGHKKDKKVKWNSSNKKVAIVSKKGVVTGKKGGTAKITATIGKKKYKTKVTVFVGEKVVYDYDADPEPTEDRYDLSNIDITDSDTSVQYEEWMTSTQLEKTGLGFFIFPNSSTLHITGQTEKNSISGIAKSYNLTDIPKNPETNAVYGTDLRYKWDGNNFLYNTNDMKNLGLIVQ